MMSYERESLYSTFIKVQLYVNLDRKKITDVTPGEIHTSNKLYIRQLVESLVKD